MLRFDEWRAAARPLLAAQVSSDAIDWIDLRIRPRARGLAEVAAPDEAMPEVASPEERAEAAPMGLASPAALAVPAAGAAAAPGAARSRSELRIPRVLLRLLETIADFRDSARWDLMYRLAFRTLYVNARLLEDAADEDVRRASLMEREIRRDCHKMHAFVRFREVDASGEKFLAWFEPSHYTLTRGAQFFVKRFPNMQWSIVTPDGAAIWNREQLDIIDAPHTLERAPDDAHETLWRVYYRNICNVARINPAAMQKEMPQRYWNNLPEAAEIHALLREGHSNFAHRQRESEQAAIAGKAVQRALERLPSLDENSLQACRRCDLWKSATQAVDGEGPRDARMMLVGEQPGDEEDLRGRPFVGPAGRVLDEALSAAQVDRSSLFVTNAVKHFKWQPRGKRRLHQKPVAGEIDACGVWLEREIAQITPLVIVALGATAARALSGRSIPIESARAREFAHVSGAKVRVTYHPSAILRSEEPRASELRSALVHDLASAAQSVRTISAVS